MPDYYILYYPGSGGMFLNTVLAMSLHIVDTVKISHHGHCHDLGDSYVDAGCINLVGWHWIRAQRRPRPFLNGHYNNISQVKKDYPECSVILIDVDDCDIQTVTNLRFFKTMNPIRPREYKKFVDHFRTNNWPSYNDVLADPLLIKDSITRFDSQWFKEWKNDIDYRLVDARIPFRSLFESTFSTVNNLLKLNNNLKIQKFVNYYQTANLNLYKL